VGGVIHRDTGRANYVHVTRQEDRAIGRLLRREAVNLSCMMPGKRKGPELSYHPGRCGKYSVPDRRATRRGFLAAIFAASEKGAGKVLTP